MAKPLSIGFRPDIQGLRAIAVILVILAHLGLPWVAGGFVGVDIFFVLSGFLITGLLLTEHQATNTIALGAFYLRRLRRLLPVLIVVILTSAAVVAWLMPKADSQIILGSLPFAASWTSNLFFALRQQDYFNELAEKDVFVHTWSLGVEEQFYLFWPLLLLAAIAVAHKIQLQRTLLLVAVASFIGCIAWTYWQPISAFYMMPARIWQFALGALVYVFASQIRPHNSHSTLVSTSLAALGLLLILASALLLDQQSVYPGYLALLPSGGAAMVILSGCLRHSSNQNPTGLANPILVWLGDRSYSLYLWHWPVITVIELLEYKWLNGAISVCLAITITVALSVISYQFIELPFWKQKLKKLPAKTFLLGTGASVALALAVSFHVQRVPTGVSKPTMDVTASIRNDFPILYRYSCDAWYHHAKVEPCIFGPNTAPNTAVLIADSIGAQWFSALTNQYVNEQWRLVVLTKSACSMVDEDYFYPRIGKIYEICTQWRNAVIDQIDVFKPNIIILGGSATYDYSAKQWLDGSKRVLDRLSSKTEKIVIISGAPTLGFDGPSCIGQHIKTKQQIDNGDCISDKSVDKFVQVANILHQAAKEFTNVSVFNPVELVCPNGQCRAITSTGIPVYRDSQHLTDTFVKSVAKDLAEYLPNTTNSSN